MLTYHQWGTVTITWCHFHKRYLSCQLLKLLYLKNYLSKLLFKLPRDQWVDKENMIKEFVYQCLVHPSPWCLVLCDRGGVCLCASCLEGTGHTGLDGDFPTQGLGWFNQVNQPPNEALSGISHNVIYNYHGINSYRSSDAYMHQGIRSSPV